MKVFAIFCTKNVALAPLGIFALKSKRFNAHTQNNQPTNRLCFRTNHKSKMTSLGCILSQKKTSNTNCTGYLLKRNKHANFRKLGKNGVFAASFLLPFFTQSQIGRSCAPFALFAPVHHPPYAIDRLDRRNESIIDPERSLVPPHLFAPVVAGGRFKCPRAL